MERRFTRMSYDKRFKGPAGRRCHDVQEPDYQGTAPEPAAGGQAKDYGPHTRERRRRDCYM